MEPVSCPAAGQTRGGDTGILQLLKNRAVSFDYQRIKIGPDKGITGWSLIKIESKADSVAGYSRPSLSDSDIGMGLGWRVLCKDGIFH
jgi:hypothetical protein